MIVQEGMKYKQKTDLARNRKSSRIKESRKPLKFWNLMIKTEKYYTIHESRRQLKLQTLQGQQTNEKEQPVPGLGK